MFYLSDEQIKKLLPQWFGKRLRKDVFDVMEFSVSRPSISLEVTKKYVAMHDIITYCICEFADDAVHRLDELFLSTRIVPRLTKGQFERLCLLLLPKLTKDQIANLHRPTVSKSKHRVQTTVEKLAKMYLEGTLLKRREDMINQGEYRLCSEVIGVFNQGKSLFTNIIDFFKQQAALRPDDLVLKIFFDDVLRYQSMLEYLMERCDGQQACLSFFNFIGSRDIMFSTLKQITHSDLCPSSKSFERA